ncbi:thiol reductant ABC exporter subunit CydD [Saccharibacter sp. 17.LH.SD]|uniref:thiol reductant ABC exporter subunit CydD n=1 Tax=Saccharibacter sp. 17.LH.SD TaxID=2689393 RepID=UPI00136C884B|nr:thiol reductant ABC exporter subunit CydD [Saccharibacter sp. 17.LH.SD]MXV43570.1 thiol reductant ABC exporter subunit CydD [Saccharibacter sp. 17.LH.SD]
MKADKKIIKSWVRQQNRTSRSITMSIALLGFVNVMMGVVQAWSLAHIFAQLLMQHVSDVQMLLVIFIICCVVRVLLSYLQELMALSAGQSARRRLRHHILERIMVAGPVLLRQNHSAKLATLLVDRVEMLDGYFARWLPASMLWVVAQWSIVAIVAWQNWHAGLVLGLCCLALPFLQAIFGIATAVASRRQFLAMSRLQTRFLDRIRGIATIVLSGNAERDAQDLRTAAEEFRHRTMKVLRVAFMASATTDIVMIVALVWIVVSQSHALMHDHSVDHASAALFAVFMVPEAFATFRALSASYQDKSHVNETAEAVHTLPQPSSSHGHDPAEKEEGAHAVLYDGRGISLVVKDVSYRWSEDRPPTLLDINFALEPGQTALLEGVSGAGKSTLIELLLGFIQPQKGQIFLGGVAMNTMSAEAITRHISWIGQRPVLFAGTLRENILFAHPNAREEEIQHALEASRVSQYLADLPDGLNTVIGEGGFGLSGGQAQRIAIARAFLKNSPLLVMDEPTAHLDPETEQDILEALKLLLQGRTALIATHSSQFKTLETTYHMTLDAGHIVSQEPKQ